MTSMLYWLLVVIVCFGVHQLALLLPIPPELVRQYRDKEDARRRAASVRQAGAFSSFDDEDRLRWRDVDVKDDDVFSGHDFNIDGTMMLGDFDANGKFTPNPASEFRLPFQTTPGEKVRGMVKVYEYETGGTSQLPCAQPIPLNDNGRPRKSGLMPLVYGYQVHRAIDLTKTLGLRLF
jgi:hypothetical protein